jgi:hypothetical protein
MECGGRPSYLLAQYPVRARRSPPTSPAQSDVARRDGRPIPPRGNPHGMERRLPLTAWRVILTVHERRPPTSLVRSNVVRCLPRV